MGIRYPAFIPQHAQQRDGHSKDYRTNKQTEKTKEVQAAEHGEEDQQWMHLSSTANQVRSQYVVDQEDYKSPPDQYDGLDPTPAGQQIDRSRHPHRSSATHWQQREERRDHSPQNR